MQPFSSTFHFPRSRLAAFRQRLTQQTARQLQRLFGKSLPTPLFCASPPPNQPHTRKRLFTHPIIFWAFLMQTLHHFPCRGALQKIRLLLGKTNRQSPSADTSGYCQARLRLPTASLKKIFNHTGQVLEKEAPHQSLWQGRRVRVVDCTTAKMPDTRKNQAAYPQPSVQKPGCGFPVVKIIAVFSLATGVMLHFLTAAHTVADALLFKLIWNFFQAGEIVLADRAFVSYAAIAHLKDREVEVVFRLSAVRAVDFRKGKRLGKNDALFLWHRPLQRTPNMTCEELAALPQTLLVRILRFQVTQPGFRTKTVTLVTTLVDPVAHPPEALAQLFYRRWAIELCFRDIKSTMNMEMLACKSPQMIEKEILMFFITHNLIRHLIWQSAEKYQLHLWQLSFKGALDLLINAAPFFANPKPGSRMAKDIYNTMLAFIAEDVLPLRPGRVEPRVIKRRPKPYQLLTKPRHLMREISHRGKK